MLTWLKTLTRRLLASTTSKPAAWFLDWLHQDRENESGVAVDGTTALRYAPVWNAVNRICGRVAQLPLVLYEDGANGTKRRATAHPAYQLLKHRPNALMSAAVFKELLQYHALMWGNGRAAILRDRRGDPTELVPLMPETTKTVIVDGSKWHVTTVTVDQDGRAESFKFRDPDVLHVAGLGYDGIQGYALWELAKTSWGLGLAEEKSSARLARNNAVPGLMLEAPPGIFADDTEAKKFLQNFRDMHEGVDNRGKTGLLREGIKASRLAQTAQEAQAIEQRSFQREEAGLWFLLESMLGIDSSVSYNSLEQKQLAELINCLNPWLVKWQEECWVKLLREREKAADSHFWRFSTGALLRSDTMTTYQTLTMGVRGRIITPNEARAVLDLDPLPGGDELQNPAIDPLRRPAAGGGSAKDDPTDPSNPTDPTDESDESDAIKARLQALITARLQDLAAVEAKRIAAAAAKPDTFAGWLPRFYDSWKTTLAEALRPCLTPVASADTEAKTIAGFWCVESQRLIAADPHDLTAWPQRAAALAVAMTTDHGPRTTDIPHVQTQNH